MWGKPLGFVPKYTPDNLLVMITIVILVVGDLTGYCELKIEDNLHATYTCFVSGTRENVCVVGCVGVVVLY